MKRLVGAGARAAEPMDRLATGSSPPLPAFAVPDKRGRLLIPVPRGLLKPAPDLVWAVRVLSVQRPSLEDALNRLRHIEPAAAHGCVVNRAGFLGGVLAWITRLGQAPPSDRNSALRLRPAARCRWARAAGGG